MIFIGPLTCIDSKTNPVPWKLDLCYRSESMRKYNRILRDSTADAMFIDLQGSIKDTVKLLHHDGLHPNTKGHEVIFNTVKEYLKKGNILEL